MRSSRRQRNLAPETSATMENVGGRVSNSNSASDARPSPSPLALTAVPDHVPQDLSNQRSRVDVSNAAASLLSLRRDFHRASAQSAVAAHHLSFLESCLEDALVPSGLQLRLKPQIYKEGASDVSTRIASSLLCNPRASSPAIINIRISVPFMRDTTRARAHKYGKDAGLSPSTQWQLVFVIRIHRRSRTGANSLAVFYWSAVYAVKP